MKFTPKDIAETALRKAGKHSDVAYVQIIEEMINNLLAEQKASFISSNPPVIKSVCPSCLWLRPMDKRR